MNNAYFLKAALNAKRKQQGLEELDAMDFMALRQAEGQASCRWTSAMLQRSVNEGFSGGEKKRNEIFHMAVLEPTLAMLDETDSGLDIDALRVVSDGVNAMRSPERSFIVVTHYQRLLNYIVPDYVHVLSEGRIVRSGGRELALELEEKGYVWLERRGGSEASDGDARCRLARAGRWLTRRRVAARSRPREAVRGGGLSDDAAGRLALHQRRRRSPSRRLRLAAPDVPTSAGTGRRRQRLPGAVTARHSQRLLRGRSVGPERAAAGRCASPACATARATRPTASRRTWHRCSASTTHPFAALNTAFLEDGVAIMVTAGARC